jgi:hypothetical protein
MALRKSNTKAGQSPAFVFVVTGIATYTICLTTFVAL